jgi:hypothetical protein
VVRFRTAIWAKSPKSPGILGHRPARDPRLRPRPGPAGPAPKGDVSDWLEQGHNADELCRLAQPRQRLLACEVQFGGVMDEQHDPGARSGLRQGALAVGMQNGLVGDRAVPDQAQQSLIARRVVQLVWQGAARVFGDAVGDSDETLEASAVAQGACPKCSSPKLSGVVKGVSTPLPSRKTFLEHHFPPR